MVKIIAVHNQKGGVGKTTTTTNVGFELARKGYKVLLADLDPQATLTSALGVTDPEETVFSALQGAVDGKETRLPWIRLQENISLCPSCRKMADAEYLLQNEYGRENFLKELAAKTDGGYDFVLLDCPPAVGLITVNALVAATDLIIPVQPEVASLYGLVSILDTVAVIQRKINRGLNLLGMLVTQYETIRGNGLFHGHQPFHQGGRVHEQKDGCRILQQEQQWSGRLPVPYPGDPVQIEYG